MEWDWDWPLPANWPRHTAEKSGWRAKLAEAVPFLCSCPLHMHRVTNMNAEYATSGKRVLVVDDEPGMLRYTRTLLEMDGYHVETMTSGEEVVNRLQSPYPVDLMLVDMAMPGMN